VLSVRNAISEMVSRHQPVKFPRRILEDVHAATEPLLSAVPKDVTVAVLARIEPTMVGDKVRVVFTEKNGREIAAVVNWSAIDGSRAVFFPDFRAIGLIRYLPRSLDLSNNFASYVAAELGHEIVHARRRGGSLNGTVWLRLLRHAQSLRLLDGDFGTYLKTVGDPFAEHQADVTTRQAYEKYYSTREDFEEVMDQEEVAHLIEWWLRGLLSPDQIAPVRNLIDDLLGDHSQTLSRPVPGR